MIELLVGPISSGKSTYAKKRAQQGALVLNDDSIVKILHGGDYTLYQKGLKPLYKGVENFIIQQAITMGRDLVIDRPNMKRSTRARYIAIAKALDEQAVAVMFANRGPEYHAKSRFEKDNRGKTFDHWLEAAKCHQSDYQAPTRDEGLIDIVRVEDIAKLVRKPKGVS